MRASTCLVVALLVAHAVVCTHALSRTPWQIHFGVDNNLFNPAYSEPFFYDIEFPQLSRALSRHGDPEFYTVLDCGNAGASLLPAGGSCYNTPAQDDPGWREVSAIPGLDGSIIDMVFLSRLAAVNGIGGTDLNGHVNHVSAAHPPYPCLQALDFTFFQSIVQVDPDDVVTSFFVTFFGMDDGARVSIFNSMYPTGLVIAGSYVESGGTGTEDLSSYVVPGSNRVLITQMDDCAIGNNLKYASVMVNGNTVAPTTNPCTTTDASSSAASASSSSSGTCTCLQFD